MDLFKKLTTFVGRALNSGALNGPGTNLGGMDARPQAHELPTDTEAQRIIRQICYEALAGGNNWQAKIGESQRWQELKGEPEALQIEVMLAALDQDHASSRYYSGNAGAVEEVRRNIVSGILRRQLNFEPEHLKLLLQLWAQQRHSLEYGLPGQHLLSAVERFAQSTPLPPNLVALLKKILHRASPNILRPHPNKYETSVANRISKLLDPTLTNQISLPKGAFAKAWETWLSTLPQPKREAWFALSVLAAESGDKAKPSKKWLAQAAELCGSIGQADVSSQLTRLFEATLPDPEHPDPSLDILKGFIWCTTQLDSGEFAGKLSRFAEKCFRKVPNFGARSVKLGNAAVWALAEMAGEASAAAELFRLGQKIKYPSARKLIDTKLTELANKSGQSVEALEDASLPHFDLSADSVRVVEFGAARVVLKLHAEGIDQSWLNAAGKPVKSVPSEVRKDHAAALASFVQSYKDLEAARETQVLRLEQAWLEDRTWTFADWKANFLNHPVRRPIVQSLIWRVADQDILPCAEKLETVTGSGIEFPDDACVSLWHPITCSPATVLAWRDRIVELGLTQPIKQAHREIYVLTDAEISTSLYSNRFAAHILRQHQFKALCQARGWAFNLMGGWDGWNVPTKRLPKHNLVAEYHVDTVDNNQTSDSGIVLYLSSDQVRFLRTNNEPVELSAVPPILFSEILRDVDLFVAVTSVANDPNWADGGPNGRFGTYWQEWAFGELGQSANTRKELLTKLAPKLSIADKLEIKDKFLIVQGKRQKYAIHFGSGNIQILPSNRYLCIVPDRTPPETTGLKLPFAGDGLFATILAKAFLLVDESKIKDQTILSQL